MNVRTKIAVVAVPVVALAALIGFAGTTMGGVNGFDYATDRDNTIANGGYHTDGDVHVMAARIVASEPGKGVFIATITVDAAADAVEFNGLTGVDAEPFEPVRVESNGLVNLFTAGALPVTGDFGAGSSVPVELAFEGRDPIKVNAIVVTQCREFADPVIAGAEPAAAADHAADEHAADDHAADKGHEDEAHNALDPHNEYNCLYNDALIQGTGGH